MHYRRVITPGAIYFFTVNLQDRKSKLLIENIEKLRISFKKARKYYPFYIDGVVILHEHLHILMRLPDGDGNYSLCWNMIKGFFSKQIPRNEIVFAARENKRERGIWQKRFWEHLIRDEVDYQHHLNYIHFNPVKHGYVTKAVDWPYSSIHRYIRDGILTAEWGCDEVFSPLKFGE